MRMPARLAATTSAVLLTLALGACSGGASDGDTHVRPIADLQDVDGTSEDRAAEAAEEAAAADAAQQAAAAEAAAAQAAVAAEAQRLAEEQAAAAAPPAAAGTYYENCTAVKAAGAAPIRAGQPGYSRKLDRDGDGVACET